MAAKRSVRQRLKDKYADTKKRIKKGVNRMIPKKQRAANPFNARAARSTIREHNKEIDIRKYMR